MTDRTILKYRFEDPKLNQVLEEIIRKINDKIEWILSPTFATLKLEDTDDTHYLSLKWNEDEVVDNRTFNLLVNAADRTVDLSGNITVEASTTLDQDYTSDATVRFAKLGLSMAATSELAVTGTSVLDGAVIINESGSSTTDTRIEGGTATNLILADASTDRVGINEDAPVCLLHTRLAESAVYAGVATDVVALFENDDHVRLHIQCGASGTGYIDFCDAAYNPAPGRVAYDHANEWMEFVAGANELMYLKDGYFTTAAGVELAVGDFGTPTNPLHVEDAGTATGGGSATEVVARFRNDTADKHTAIAIDALSGRDPVLYLSENGSSVWGIRNDASDTDNFEIRYQTGGANRTDFIIDNAGDFTMRGTVSCGSSQAQLVLADGSITDGTGAISFGDENLSTTGTLGSGAFTMTQNSDTVTITHDGGDAYFKTSDGYFIFVTDEGDNTDTHVHVKGKGTGRGLFRVFDQDDAEYFTITCVSGYANFTMGGTSPLGLNFLYDQPINFYLYPGLTSGNPYFYQYGYDSGASSTKYLRTRVESDGDALIESQDNLNITAGGGSISFGDENLSTTGTLGCNTLTMTSNSDTVEISHDGTDPWIKWSDGILKLTTDEGTNADTEMNLYGKGTGRTKMRLYDQDSAEYLYLTCSNGVGYIYTAGTTPGAINFQYYGGNMMFFQSCSSGTTPYLYVYGNPAGTTYWGSHRITANSYYTIEGQTGVYLGANSIPVIGLTDAGAWAQDNLPFSLGTDGDYSFVYASTGDELQLVDGKTVSTNKRMTLDSSGDFDFQSGNLSTTGTLKAGAITTLERGSDPTEPAEGECVIWMSDGTGKGDDGDLMVASKAGGTTNYGTLFDHSGGAGW